MSDQQKVMRDRIDTLMEQWQALLSDQPQLRIRAAAQQLGVSELTLLRLRQQHDPAMVIDLRSEFEAVYRGLQAVGEVMVLTRNDVMVHEKIGAFGQLRSQGNTGLLLGEIDLRIFFQSFKQGFAVQEAGAKGVRHSLQFFDADGQALHKIYQVEATDHEAWQLLVDRFATVADDRAGFSIQPWPGVNPAALLGPQDTTPPRDVAAMQADWMQLQDVHQFRGLLHRHQTDRVSAYPCVDNTLACPLAPEAFESALEKIAASELSVMIFVGSPGVIQIHTGPLYQLRRTGPWYNVLDARFNLHANTPQVAQCWRVRKPTRDGWVSSLELFAADGSQILQLFGERHEGESEQVRWQQLLLQLEQTFGPTTRPEAAP